MAYQAGVSLVDLKYLYGHESVDMTTHYSSGYFTLGLDEESARRGLTAFGETMRPHLQADGIEAKP